MHPVLFWILTYFGIGIALGLIICVMAVYQKYTAGDDLVVSDVGDMAQGLLISFFIWPLVLLMFAAEGVEKFFRVNKNTVILRGSKSAKTYKALRED